MSLPFGMSLPHGKLGFHAIVYLIYPLVTTGVVYRFVIAVFCHVRQSTRHLQRPPETWATKDLRAS